MDKIECVNSAKPRLGKTSIGKCWKRNKTGPQILALKDFTKFQNEGNCVSYTDIYRHK